MTRQLKLARSTIKSAKAVTLSVIMIGLSAIASCSAGFIMPEGDPSYAARAFLRQDITAKSHPNAEMIYLLDEATIEVTDSGESVQTVHTVIKILTEAGRSNGDCEIGFNSRTETVTLLYARTIYPDGSAISLKSDAIKIVTPHSRFPEYSDYKEMRFSIPGIGIGSILDYKYVKKTVPEIGKHFNEEFFFQCFDPVLLSRYRIIAPEAMPINIYLRNSLEGFSRDPVVSSANGKKCYLWEYRNISQILYEDDMPPLDDIAYHLYATTNSSWDEYCGSWWSQAKDKIEADASIKEKVLELTAKSNLVDSKIRALFDYVKKDIRYVTISLGKSGLIPKMAPEVYENKYGDCKDKSTLLIAMLKEAGITAHHALIPTRSMGELVKEFPYPLQFNHCIVAVERDGTMTFLDPTSKTNCYDYLPLGDQDREVVVIREGKPVFWRTPVASVYGSGTISQRDISIMEEGSATIKQRTQFIGSREVFARSAFSDVAQSELRKSFEEMAFKKFQGSRLIDYTVSNPQDESMKFETSIECFSDRYYRKAGDLIILPEVSNIGQCPAAGALEPEHPVMLKERSFKRNEVRINIPSDYDVYFLPEAVELDNKYFEYRSNYEKKGDEVFHVNEYVTKSIRIPLEDYAVYREYCRMMKESFGDRILLRKQR